jgi:DNA-binding transcriptional LysR family regulator
MPDLRDMTLRQLRALSATTRRGSVTGAARDLSVTPPAVTAQLKNLEALAGAPLFDRTLNGFAPTAVGEALLETAADIEHQISRLGEQIDALKAGTRGQVTFAVVSSGKYLAPSIVARFQRTHPDVRVKLVIGNRSEVVRGLEENRFDLVLMGRPPTHLPVTSTVLADHPHVLIARRDHRLVGDHDILAEDLLAERFLAREQGSGTRALMDRFLEQVGGGRDFQIVEMGTNETIKQAVMAGLGLAIISVHTCFSELAEGKLATLTVRGLPLVRQWRLLHREDRHLGASAALMKTFVMDHRRDLFPRYQGA